jgi:hypothetical protein
MRVDDGRTIPMFVWQTIESEPLIDNDEGSPIQTSAT